VVDLAKAHLAALKFMDKEEFEGYDVFNIGTGRPSSVLEVIRAFETITGEKLNYTIGARRGGDVEKVWGDVAKSTNELNWQAELDLDIMMASAWEWEKYIDKNPL
jgi:UDP-glucose 4-epimerase